MRMINKDDLYQAKPNVETATTRYVRGDISRAEYERQVQLERAAEHLAGAAEQPAMDRPSEQRATG